jgi:hypothetical protein
VTFNPWYQRQFAIVDIRGKWSVWEITGRQRLQQSSREFFNGLEDPSIVSSGKCIGTGSHW